ncbi:MAG: DUF2339 domain-containing protein [Candidatus Nitronauta litoralis]|uniref:DUF2339 domain-containing protein n=1 Tax=Candidatus Nitronauta litoralis TaxID=2705533 RepID=A0A7T0BUU3_9BACT|nr:MAG: DUF2339 domain-containing protein [Candidatus Nitronauta litoralis]
MEKNDKNTLKARIGRLDSMVNDLRNLAAKIDREMIAIKQEIKKPLPQSKKKTVPAKKPPEGLTQEPELKPTSSTKYENPVPLFYEKEKEVKVHYPDLDDPKEDAKEKPEPGPSSKPVATGETWLSRIGITLLLLGVVFLVKYSIDQGWINPAVRLMGGFLIGAVLVRIGFQNRESRDKFSQILQGGGIAVFYIVGFAAYQIYELVPHTLAFAYMVAVSVTGVVLSLRQEFLSLSMVSLLGGLATPFLLRSGSMNLSGLVGYNCLLLAGTLWVFYHKGWKALFITSIIGGWLAQYLAVKGIHLLPRNAPDHRMAIQAGLAFTWLAFWWAPLLQILRDEIGIASPSEKEKDPALPFRWNQEVSHLSLSLLGNAILAFFFTTLVWQLHTPDSGWIPLGAMFCYAMASWKLYPKDTTLGWLNAMMAVTMGTLSLVFLLDGDTLIFSLALEATAMHWLAHRLEARLPHNIAHGLFALVFVWLAGRLLLMGMEPPPVLNQLALTDLAVLVFISISAFRLKEGQGRLPYLVMAYLGMMVWWVREIASLPNGDGFVSIAWGVQGAALFIIGLQRNTPAVFRVGFATLVVVALKLLIVDLSDLDTIWRILLFMGIGAGFLGLSYKVQDLWKQPEGAGKAKP